MVAYLQREILFHLLPLKPTTVFIQALLRKKICSSSALRVVEGRWSLLNAKWFLISNSFQFIFLLFTSFFVGPVVTCLMCRDVCGQSKRIMYNVKFTKRANNITNFCSTLMQTILHVSSFWKYFGLASSKIWKKRSFHVRTLATNLNLNCNFMLPLLNPIMAVIRRIRFSQWFRGKRYKDFAYYSYIFSYYFRI